ncbi:MAG: hypothetical protein LUI02_03205 [Clostridiales bacterium]|nr:hypothetical protein [Clostridiales bacterium]
MPESARIKRDNSKAQRNLNDKNARKRLVRLVNTNFVNGDLWITLTYDDGHLPADMERAQRDIRNWIRRVNYRRGKQGLPKAKYIYVTEHGTKTGRFHHHVVMDGALSGDEIEGLWRLGRRNEIRHLDADEDGFSGMANYIAKEKDREKYEKRWSSSQGLKEPGVKIVKSKRPHQQSKTYKKIATYVSEMVKDQGSIEDQMRRWYPDYTFTSARIRHNSFNGMIYIQAKMRLQI